MKDKYVNLFTDFGFKKLFGEEDSKETGELFEKAQIAKFDPAERQAYENSLKYYRDMKNSIDTARDEGIELGKQEGEQAKTLEIARNMLSNDLDVALIMRLTGLSIEAIQRLR